ncbi:MAG: FecR family protein, partial [Ignavibacteriales bacterium]
MTTSDTLLSDRELLEEAAAWRLRIFGEDEPAPEDAEAFDRWLSASPRHQQAFDRTGDAWDLFEPHAAAPEVIRARRDALEFARRSSRNRWASGLTRRGGFRIAASIAVAAVLGAVSWPMIDGVDVYRTHLGERREVTLSDGSTVALDSNSRVRVHYTADARQLTLEKGQARFQVAHNRARPFSVTAGDRRVVATGTAFNIELLGKRVNVTLIEGSVVVATVSPPEPLAP